MSTEVEASSGNMDEVQLKHMGKCHDAGVHCLRVLFSRRVFTRFLPSVHALGATWFLNVCFRRPDKASSIR